MTDIGSWGFKGAQRRGLELPSGSSVALSQSGRATIRYNESTNDLEISRDGAAYEAIDIGGVPAGSPWKKTGTVVELVTTSDTVAIGATAMSGDGERARVVGQLLISDATPGAGGFLVFDEDNAVPAFILPKRPSTDGSGLTGRSINIRGAFGANADATTPGATGGDGFYRGGPGGAGSAARPGGNGGEATLLGGSGGTDGGGTGGAGGAANVTGGSGVAGSDGGATVVAGGAGGAVSGAGGSVTVVGGASAGGNAGSVNVGTSDTLGVTIGSDTLGSGGISLGGPSMFANITTNTRSGQKTALQLAGSDCFAIQTTGRIEHNDETGAGGFWAQRVGGATQISFFGGATVIKQTLSGAKGGNAALASVIAALVAYGIAIDTTT
jgi:hypothetical protein